MLSSWTHTGGMPERPPPQTFTPRKMTHAELADVLGVTESYVSYLRAGKRQPSAEILSRIIRAFNFDEHLTYELMTAYGNGNQALVTFLDKQLPRVD